MAVLWVHVCMLILKHYTDVNIYSYLYEYEYIFHTHTYIYTTITYMLYIKIRVQVNKCSPWLFSLCRLEYLSTQTYHLICLQLFSWMFWGQIRSFSAQVEVPSSTIPLWLAWVHPLQKKSRWKKNHKQTTNTHHPDLWASSRNHLFLCIHDCNHFSITSRTVDESIFANPKNPQIQSSKTLQVKQSNLRCLLRWVSPSFSELCVRILQSHQTPLVLLQALGL